MLFLNVKICPTFSFKVENLGHDQNFVNICVSKGPQLGFRVKIQGQDPNFSTILVH